MEPRWSPGTIPAMFNAPRSRRAAIIAAAALLAFACGPTTAIRATADPSPQPASQSANIAGSKPILCLANDEDAAFLAAARPLNAERCMIVYESSFIDGGRIDENKLRRAVSDKIPDGWNGFACLDIENEWFKNLSRDPQSAEYRSGVDNLLRAIQIARAVRPDCKWSFYGIPNLPFFVKDAENRTVGWDKVSPESKARTIAVAKQAQPVVDACDWLAPTVYDPYFDATNPEWIEAQKARVRESVALAREMGAVSGAPRPVLVFVWHRIHNSNKQDPLRLLGNPEFLEGQVLPALQSGAAGVVWWGADRYMIRSGELGKAQPAEAAALTKDADATSAYLLRINKEKLDGLAPHFQR